MTDTFAAASAFSRSLSSAVSVHFLLAICSQGHCCISASDYREARLAEDVNLLHIPANG